MFSNTALQPKCTQECLPSAPRGLFLVQIKEHVCRCLLCAIASMVMFCALGILNNVGYICTLQSSIHHGLKDKVKCRWSLTIEMTTWYRIMCSRKRFRSKLWIFNHNFHDIYCCFVCKKATYSMSQNSSGCKVWTDHKARLASTWCMASTRVEVEV